MKLFRLFRKKIKSSPPAEVVTLFILLQSGDEMLTASPVFRGSKKTFPDRKKLLLTSPGNEILLRGQDVFNEVIYLDDNFEDVIDKLPAKQITEILDLTGNAASIRICSFLKKKNDFPVIFRSGFSFLQKLGIGNKHDMFRFLEVASRSGIIYDGRGLNYEIPPNERILQDDLPGAHMLGFIVIVLDAENEFGNISREEIYFLCETINHPIIIVGAANEKDFGESLVEIDDVKNYNAVGKFSFNETADIISKSKLVISPYCIFLLLAAAFDKALIEVGRRRSITTDASIFYEQAKPAPAKERIAIVNLSTVAAGSTGNTDRILKEVKRLLLPDPHSN